MVLGCFCGDISNVQVYICKTYLYVSVFLADHSQFEVSDRDPGSSSGDHDTRLNPKKTVPYGMHPMHMLSDKLRAGIWIGIFFGDANALLQENPGADLQDVVFYVDLPGKINVVGKRPVEYETRSP